MQKLKFRLCLLVIGAILSQVSCVSSETKNQVVSSATARHPSDASPVLTIKSGGETRQFSRDELLKNPSLQQIVVDHDPAYPGKRMTYSAIPIKVLFAGLTIDGSNTLLFSCLDGFSAPISWQRLFDSRADASIAYLAIETEAEKWPALKKEDPNKTAGPFYLVWKSPEKSKIGTEEWPFQLAGFEVKASLESQFPHTVPDASFPEQSLVKKGYRAFMQNCFACHTLNGEGTSQLGPDLNIPFSPMEYMKPNYFMKLVRNPQNLRRWPQSKMAGFDRSALSDEDLSNIVRYLQHMSSRKVRQ